MRSASLWGMPIPVSSTEKKMRDEDTVMRRTAFCRWSTGFPVWRVSAGAVNFRALSSTSDRALTAACRLVFNVIFSAPGATIMSNVKCLAVLMPEASAASVAICMARTRSLHSMTDMLLASDNSSILFTRLVMRSVFSVICCLISSRVSSSYCMPGVVSNWV